MILGDVLVPGKALQCGICLYQWVSIASELPESCPNKDCRSREWNGKKKRAVKPRITLPKPTKVRAYNDEESTEF